MTPRDRLAQDLAALLPGCHVTADGASRIRIGFPGIGMNGAAAAFLAVSKSGRRVEACDFQGRAPVDAISSPVVTAGAAAEIAVGSIIGRLWNVSSPTIADLERLSALGFAHKVPALVTRALRRLDHDRAENAEQIRAKQDLDTRLAAEQDAYRSLLETP